MYRLRFFLSAAMTVLLADQFSKRWVQSFLEDRSCGQIGNCKEVFSGVRMRLLFNDGAAFSTGEGFGRWFALAAVFVLIFLAVLAWRRVRPLHGIVLGVVAGGAAGNLYDRLLRSDGEGLGSGAVVDFIDIGPWPVFNLADSAITVGAIALVFMGFEDPEQDHPDEETGQDNLGSGTINTTFEDEASDQDSIDDTERGIEATILEADEVDSD